MVHITVPWSSAQSRLRSGQDLLDRGALTAMPKRIGKLLTIRAKRIRIVKAKHGKFSLHVDGQTHLERNSELEKAGAWFPKISPYPPPKPPQPSHPVSDAGCAAEASFYCPWPTGPQPELEDQNGDDDGNGGNGDDGDNGDNGDNGDSDGNVMIDVSCIQGAECRTTCQPNVSESDTATDIWCTCTG